MSAEHAFDLVIFDYDGTLSDTRFAIAHCIASAFAKHGRSAPARERIMLTMSQGRSLRDTCLVLYPKLREDEAALGEIVGTYRALYRDESEPLIKMFPGAAAVLQELHAIGVKCVVVSNKGFDAVRRALDQFAMAALVSLVFAEEAGVPTKPDPALLTGRILPRFPQIPRERVLMVGDTEIDIEFAARAGVACCWAAYGFGDRERCLALSPTYVIESIEELPALIRRHDDGG
jgi:phosphoglycolate phosphatase